MEKEFDLLVFIGRFQPFHLEHKRIIDIALQKSKNVLVLVGSAGKARNIRNPFTFDERARFIFDSFPESTNINVAPLYDKTYNENAWILQAQDTVHSLALEIANEGVDVRGFTPNGTADIKIGLIGAAKDNTSYYLKLFPTWGSVNVTLDEPMHATAIRESFFNGENQKYQLFNTVPTNVANFMFDEFYNTPAYAQLKNELEHIKAYKKSWEAAPYPVKHNTCDAVVEQGGHVLLVKRRAEPGKGLWAIPGGHLEEYEPLVEGVLRELREETKLKVPDAVLRGSVVGEKMFDDPYRSNIGRVITFAMHFKLNGTTLPKVKGSDDAEKAKWVPISDIREDMLFDDHYHILCYFLGI